MGLLAPSSHSSYVKYLMLLHYSTEIVCLLMEFSSVAAGDGEDDGAGTSINHHFSGSGRDGH